jgi:phosphatidylserine/phosphatidylglycerophosphate/cardiolipin synthase-like enzyme
VKIILEHSPYLAVMLNKKYFKEYEKEEIDIVWSNPDNYTLNHSKIILIDGSELILSTGNFTASNFKKNRDLFIFTKDKKVVFAFSKIFEKDFI